MDIEALKKEVRRLEKWNPLGSVTTSEVEKDDEKDLADGSSMPTGSNFGRKP